ncbi:MAG: hypothetical protein WC516_10055 [Patescibacteria group bacterium]|jgi:apolipoprotein N-acyltransferase
MNKDYKYWLRWLAVLPGALLAGLLATFPLHWILYLVFAHDGTILGFIELPDGVNKSIEYMLYPFVVAFTFILVGYKIAPKYKFRTTIVLFGIYTLLWFISTFASLFLKIEGVQISFSGRTIFALLGAAIGLYIASRKNKHK